MDGGVCRKVVFVAELLLSIDLRWGGGAPERSGGVTEGALDHARKASATQSSANCPPEGVLALPALGSRVLIPLCTAHGKVVKKQTSPTQIKGHKAAASKDEPQFIVETVKGKRAAHKAGALKKERVSLGSTVRDPN